MKFIILIIISHLGMFSFYGSSSAEAMVGDAFSNVLDGNGLQVCATDQPSVVTSAYDMMWCGILCVTQPDCIHFNYINTTQECDLFFFHPVSYVVLNSCIAYHIIKPNVPGLLSTATIDEQSTIVTVFPQNIPTAETTISSSVATSKLNADQVTFNPPLAISTAPNAPQLSSALPVAISTAHNSAQMSSALPVDISTALNAGQVSSALPVTFSTSTNAGQVSSAIPVAISTAPNAPQMSSALPVAISTAPNAGQVSSALPVAISTAPNAAQVSSASPVAISTAPNVGQLTTSQETTAASIATTTVLPPVPPTLPSSLQCDSYINAPRTLVLANTGNGLNQTWNSFRNGFSLSTGGYWLGSDLIHYLTTNGSTWKICFDMEDIGGTWYYAYYSSYYLNDVTTNFTFYLSTSGYSSNVGSTFPDSMSPGSNIFQFTTFDANHAACTPNLASTWGGGWWYPCGTTTVNLGGVGNGGFFWAITNFPGDRFLKTSYTRISCN